MTFYEAAIEVLRQSGRPLHYKKITEVAIKGNLLSHVGKTPEVTMSARLNQEVKREEFSALVKTRPGVFTLRDEVAKKLNEEAKQKQEEARKAQQKAQQAKQAEQEDDDDDDEDDSNRRNGRSRSRRRGRRSRRRSRRDDDDSSNKSSARSSRSDDDDSTKRSAKTNGSTGAARRRSSQDEDAEIETVADNPPSMDNVDQKHLDHGPVRLEGIAQAAHTVLSDNDGDALPIKKLADEIFNRKLVRFHTHDAAMTVQAAMVNDNQLRECRGHRPLFVRLTNSRWGLTEWGMTPDALVNEQKILSLSEECRQDTLENLGRALTDVQPEALEQVTLTLLDGRGYRNIKVSKRSSNGDVFFSADWRQGLSDVRVCIQLVGDHDTELGREVVTELRGTLHHYAASEGVVIHFGDISKEAIEESREDKLAPMTLLDRKTFVELLVDQGIGVRQYHTPILAVDTGFIDELKTT